jgi:hypothetical protein
MFHGYILQEKSVFSILALKMTNLAPNHGPNGTVVLGDVEHDGRPMLYVIKGAGPHPGSSNATDKTCDQRIRLRISTTSSL